MRLAVDIVKHNGQRQSEIFMRRKLYSSVIAACLSVRAPQGQAEEIADKVCDYVSDWLQKKPEVTSQDIRVAASRQLKIQSPEAAYLYEQYHITI